MNLQVKENLFAHPPSSFGDEIYYPESDGQPLAETDVHANLLIYLKKALEIFFAEREDVYVTGNIRFYYVEGDPTQFISPDVMVCFGVPKKDRTSYKTWEEEDISPSVVIEISSRSTWSKDRVEKRLLYELLGVKEYYIFNPQPLKNSPAFLAYFLENEEYASVSVENNRVESKMLDLELVVSDNTLRLYNPKTKEFLKTIEEFAEENNKLKAEIARIKKLLGNS